ncbi:MAG: DUF86 domain-containing protein [Syntrophomonadaceae bacterium]|nr:DUF86 domain-containing protein [Syntrophomonadaceae bacterium]
MLDKQRVLGRVDKIRRSINRLADFQQMSFEEFRENADNYAIAEHHLRRALENLFDIGRHLLVKGGLGHPDNYREVIDMLGKAGIIPMNFASRIRGMAGYRNRLIHEYERVDEEEIYNIVTTKLKDFSEFVEYILDYIVKKRKD